MTAEQMIAAGASAAHFAASFVAQQAALEGTDAIKDEESRSTAMAPTPALGTASTMACNGLRH